MQVFNPYWRILGLPLSRLKGGVTDSIPFSIVELSLWLGGIATILWLTSFSKFGKSVGTKIRWVYFLFGPLFLLILGLGQGAFPWSLAPTALRTPLPTVYGTDSLSDSAFHQWVRERERSLTSELNWTDYQSLSESEVLRNCDASLDTVLRLLGQSPGRTVRAVKDMGPLTSDLGLIYGGPAFHDPFFGELAVVKSSQYPTPRHWRLIAVCHETAHAKGFLREMDAEILTQLALRRIADPRFQTLADIHFLEKSGVKVLWPESLIRESQRVRTWRREVQKHQPVISWLRNFAEKFHVRNSGGKYGDREAKEAWNPHHPFFATVHRLQNRVISGKAIP